MSDKTLKDLVYDARATMIKRGFNPIEALVDIAMDAEDEDIKLKATKELAGFYAPKFGTLSSDDDKEKGTGKIFVQINNVQSQISENGSAKLKELTQEIKAIPRLIDISPQL